MRLKYQRELIFNQAIQMCFLSESLYEGNEKDFFMKGGNPGFRGIQENGAWLKSYHVLSLDYQIPIKFYNSGTWTVAPFIDTGLLNSPLKDNPDEHFTSIGIGTYYFLKNIAVPGIGIAAGVNDKYQETYFKFTIGFSF